MERAKEIREGFLRFFENREHTRIPSSSLIPSGDPTLLFTSAGMVPFKPFFLGEQKPPSTRMTSCQKCFRTTDIDEVGDSHHATFFEMLGNFSFGDYFKDEAIIWAWEFTTSKKEGLGLSKDRLHVTIYADDQQSFELWNSKIGLPLNRIHRYGANENWWGPAGLEGPSGPCSEIHYDFGVKNGCGQPIRRSDVGDGCHPNHECDRFVELWNIVFMEYYQKQNGDISKLPVPSVDTGMGLERATAIAQGLASVYETDLFEPIMSKASHVSGKDYGLNEETNYALRVISEHSRSASFLIADGVVPSNEGRGYVLRRIIRRAIRYGRRLGLTESFLAETADVAIENYSNVYPDLLSNREYILKLIDQEEARFIESLKLGIPRIGELIDNLQDKDDESRLTALGSGAAELYDTFGIPPEVVVDFAHSTGVDMSGVGLFDSAFQDGMEQRRDKGRKAHVHANSMVIDRLYEDLNLENVEFVGYEAIENKTEILGLILDGRSVKSVGSKQRVEMILLATPFYPEGGGQVGDRGYIKGREGIFQVEDTQSPTAGLIVHKGLISQGNLSLGEEVEAVVDGMIRTDTARNHSGTHLIHSALRKVVGPHVRQAGSLVIPDKLRFDFTHLTSISTEELRDTQLLVNQKVRENLLISSSRSTYVEAIDNGALAFFGDKYGSEVRVVSMGARAGSCTPFSVELCGGTHVNATGEIGPLFILGESGIGGGTRRIEAVSGRKAEELFQERSDLLFNVATRLDTPMSDLESRLESFIDEAVGLRKRLKVLEQASHISEAQTLLATVTIIKEVNVISAVVPDQDIKGLREIGDWLKGKLSSVLLVLAIIKDGNPIVLSMVTPDLVNRGLHAGRIVQELSKILGGGGGGGPEMAQAGGKRRDKLGEALDKVSDIVTREVTR